MSKMFFRIVKENDFFTWQLLEDLEDKKFSVVAKSGAKFLCQDAAIQNVGDVVKKLHLLYPKITIYSVPVPMKTNNEQLIYLVINK